MKKTTVLFALLMSLFIILSNTVFAAEENKDMVYASKSEQDFLYELIQQESFDLHKAFKYYGLSVVKESISKVYTIDMLEYAETDEFKLVPLKTGHAKIEKNDDKGNVYVAKLLTSKNEYGGIFYFYVQENAAYSWGYSPSAYAEPELVGEQPFLASSSFVDHAQRIQNIIGKNSAITAYDVRFVLIDGIGGCFYIDNQEIQYMIPIGYHNVEASRETDTFLSENELKNIAKEQFVRYNEHKAAKELWEKEHPGEIYDHTGSYSVEPIISGCSMVDNIIDIFSYIENEMDTPIYDDIGGVLDNSNITGDIVNTPDTSAPDANVTDANVLDTNNSTDLNTQKPTNVALWVGVTSAAVVLVVGAVLVVTKLRKR